MRLVAHRRAFGIAISEARAGATARKAGGFIRNIAQLRGSSVVSRGAVHCGSTARWDFWFLQCEQAVARSVTEGLESQRVKRAFSCRPIRLAASRRSIFPSR